MISFSKQTKDAWTTLSGTPANLVNDRIYFVEGVGTFIYTTSGGLKDYNASSAVTDNITGWVDTNYIPKVSGETGEIAKFKSDGTLESTNLSAGIAEKTGFGSDKELAVESAVTGYVDDRFNDFGYTGLTGTEIAVNVNDTSREIGASIVSVPSAKVDAPWNTFAHKVNAADKDEVLVADANGDLSGSNFKIGLTTSAEFGNAAEIAVESAVTGFVASEIAKVNNAAKDAISGITFSNSTAQISYTKINGAAAVPVTETLSGLVSSASMNDQTLVLGVRGDASDISANIDGLVSSFTYSGNVVTLGIKGAASKTINIPAEQLLSGVAYVEVPSDFATNGLTATFGSQNVPLTSSDITVGNAKFGIVFRFATQTIDTQTFTTEYTFVPVEDLVKDFDPDQFELVNNKLTLKAIPSALLSGYHYAPTGWVDENYISQFDAALSSIPLADGNGELISSAYSIGAETSGSFGNNKELAVESAVTGWVADMLSFK